MATASPGDTVRVRYRASLSDGTVVDSEYAEHPFEFTLGSETVIPGFEDAITGMRAGQSKEVVVQPADGYGAYMPERVIVVERAKFANLVEPRVGLMMRVGPDESTAQSMTITEVTRDSVTLDGNHRLAGKVLSFEIHLDAINPA